MNNQRDSSIFETDPFIGCPFETDEMVVVKEHKGYKTEQKVKFQKLNEVLEGEIYAIGEKAKYGDGNYFTALIIKENNSYHLCTFDDIIKG